MTTKKKICIGGLGALTPIILNLLVVDMNVLYINLSIFAALGYLIRVVVLFYLGGLVAFLHKDETMPVKIFELGIVAPALITALINASNVDVPKIAKSASESHSSYNFFVSSVYAQTNGDSIQARQQDDLKTFSMPRESVIQQFFSGVLGRSPKNVWFVVTGEFLDLGEAKKQATEINQRHKNFKAEIYNPYGDDPHYRVVIGENMLLKAAQLLQRRAVAEGLPRETHVWTFKNE